MDNLCEFCKKEIPAAIRKKRFCNALCQRKHYNRRPEIRMKYRLRIREYRRTHPEWREKHRLQQMRHREQRNMYKRDYYKRPEVKIRVNKHMKWKLENDINYAIASRLRKSLRHALTKYTSAGKVMGSRKYGIDWKEIIDHLKPFPEDIKNYDIDHIVPLHTFDLTKFEEVRRAFSPKNLQWLTRSENRSKGGKIIVCISNVYNSS